MIAEKAAQLIRQESLSTTCIDENRSTDALTQGA